VADNDPLNSPRCLDDNTAAHFAAGELTEERQAAVEEHLDSCGDCRQLVSQAEGVTSISESVSPPRPEQGGPHKGLTFADRYTIDHELGRGGMGAVWAGEDRKLQRPVAVKILNPETATSKTAYVRFEREAMAIAKLRSPHIVEVYDYGVQDDTPYIVMELLEGTDLSGRMKRQKRTPLEGVARIVIQCAKALTTAHDAGIVHRDLKPGNIFLCLHHGDESVKVFDFGVAKALRQVGPDSETTAEGVVLGTPRFMSPEQVHGAKAIDHRSDLWSLGVIAYACLTGRYPFRAKGIGQMISQILNDEPTPPSEIARLLPSDVDAFFVKALAKDPDDRFQTAREMSTALSVVADLPSASAEYRALSDLRLSEPGDMQREPSVSTRVSLGEHTLEATANTVGSLRPGRRGGGRAFALVALVGVLLAGAWFARGMVSDTQGTTLTATAALGLSAAADSIAKAGVESLDEDATAKEGATEDSSADTNKDDGEAKSKDAAADKKPATPVEAPPATARPVPLPRQPVQRPRKPPSGPKSDDPFSSPW
jgi:serine/threonine protein kinase